MITDNGNSPAMPFVEGYGVCSVATGFTKRETIAKDVMQGFASDSEMHCVSEIEIANLSVRWADALIAAFDQR